MNIKELKEKILEEIRYGELNNDMGFVPEWLGKTDMPSHAEDVKCFRDGVTCKRYTDAVIIKNAFEEFEKTDVPDANAGQWIPCSERLPEEGESVLISTKTSDRVYVGTYTKRYGFERREGFICADGFMWLNTAIAWMPLPAPFREENNG